MLNLSIFTIHCDIIILNIIEHCFLLSGFNLSILLVNNILNIFNTSFNLFRSPWLKFGFFFLSIKAFYPLPSGVLSNDARIHWVWNWWDHYTGHYVPNVPYSLRRVCGFFNVTQIFYYLCKGLWDGAYGLSSLSEKTRKSNRLEILQRQHFLLSYLKTLSVCPAGVSGAYPIELTGRQLNVLPLRYLKGSKSRLICACRQSLRVFGELSSLSLPL